MSNDTMPAAPPRPKAEKPTTSLVDPQTRHIAIGALLVALAALTLLNSFGRTPVDIKPEVYLAPWHSAAAYVSSWQADPQLGFPSFNVGLAPVAVLVGLMQTLGASPGLSAHLLRGALAALLGWGAARLYRALARDGEDLGALVAALVAVANPYTLVAGSTLAVMLPLALLPWQLMAVVFAVRRGGWRYPALVGLTVFAMTGINAGVVPIMQGLAMPIVAIVIAQSEDLGLRRALGALVRSAVFCVAVSLYWIVPALSATAAGTTVLSNSESLDGIAGVSTFAEAVRGLGLWPMYGSDQGRAWVPQFTAYLDRPVVLVASFTLPLLVAGSVAFSQGLLRRLGLWLFVAAVVVMVGLNTSAGPTPFGWALRGVFERVPASAAFRTTNKVGAMFVLGLALLLAAGFVGLLRAAPAPARARLSIGLVALLVAATAPAWANKLYTSFVDVPGYWRTAAAALNDGSAARVWFVPGEVQSQYRWSDRRPDDISLSLLKRPSLVRTVIPVSGAYAANLLAAADTGLQEGWLAAGTLSSAARYLGADTVLLRNDQVWQDTGGARPQTLQHVIEADPGLVAAGNFGASGENVATNALTSAENILPPLQRWAVQDPMPVLRAQSARNELLVSGDGYALDELAGAGLADGQQAIRYLADVGASNGQFARALEDGARIVLTDTNRRRSTATARLTDGQGPLLGAGTDPGDTRTLGGPSTQTVLVDSGASVTATQSGSVFGPLPYAAPENAFDGNRSTSWQFGDFHTGVGASVSASFSPRAVPSVTVHTASDRTHITAVRMRLRDGARTVSATVPVARDGVARWTPPAGTRAAHFTLQVTAIAGRGFNRLSVSEINIPDLRVRRIAQLPDTLGRVLRNARVRQTRQGSALVARTPIDLEFQRVLGTTATSADDEETGLDRNFTLPDLRRYALSADVAVRSTVPDVVLDRLAGRQAGVRASSSSRLFDLFATRSANALDGDLSTAWTPGVPSIGQSITVTAPRRRISRITLTQSGTAANVASLVRIFLDGRPVAQAPAHLGTTQIAVPPQTAHTLRVEIRKTLSADPLAVVHIAEIGFGGARMHFDRRRAARSCIAVGTLDRRALRVHPLAPLQTGEVVRATECTPIALHAGAHLLRQGRGPLTLDRLAMSNLLPQARVVVGSAPLLSVNKRSQTGATVRTSGGTGPYWLALGQSLDTRWEASLDGRSLGSPQLLNGWEAGWWVPAAGGEHIITVSYGPQRQADIALAVSALALVACLVVGSGRARRGIRRRRRLRASRLRLGRLRPARVRLEWLRVGGPRPGWRAGWHVRTRPSGAHRDRVDSGRTRGRAWLWPLALTTALVFGGWLGGATMLVVAACERVGRSSERGLAIASALAFAAVPVLWLTLRPDGAAISPALVADNPWPGRAAVVGLVLLVTAALAGSRPREKRGAT